MVLMYPQVVITDYPDSVLLENISHNVSENVEKEKLGRVDVQACHLMIHKKTAKLI